MYNILSTIYKIQHPINNPKYGAYIIKYTVNNIIIIYNYKIQLEAHKQNIMKNPKIANIQ